MCEWERYVFGGRGFGWVRRTAGRSKGNEGTVEQSWEAHSLCNAGESYPREASSFGLDGTFPLRDPPAFRAGDRPAS